MATLLATLRSQPSWVKALLLALFCLVLGLILQIRTHVLTPADPGWVNPYDHHKYVHMAEVPLGSFHIAPSCWRIGVPLLVKMLPFPVLTGFRLQTFGFIVLTAILLYYVLMAAGYLEVEAFLGVMMFWSYGAANKLLLGSPYAPDPAIFAITAAALYFLLKEQDILLALTLVLGATVKETIILVIPLIYTIRAQRMIDVRLMIRTVLVGLPSLLVLQAIKHWISAYNDVESYVAEMGPQLSLVHLGTAKFSVMDGLQRVMAFRLHEESIVNMFRDLTFGNVGILWILPFFALRPASSPNVSIARSSNLMLLLRFLPFLALTYFGWFMALNADRRFAYAFPFWIMLSINGVRSLADALKIDMIWFIALFFFQYLLNLQQPLTVFVPVDLAIGMFLVTLGILYTFRDRLEPPTSVIR
jgi:hypothetical protein